MRTGAELNQATRPFAKEDKAKSWRLLLTTLLTLLCGYLATFLTPFWPLKLLFSVLTGLVTVRTFIIYHDYMHGAILRESKMGEIIMSWVGFHTLAVRSVWKETHNYHHKHNAKLIGSSIGSYPIVTTSMWQGLSKGQRLAYRIARHPLTIFLGYGPVFLIGMTFSPFVRNRKKHWGGPIAVAIHFALFAAIWSLAGPQNALFLVILPTAIAHGTGAYLFYAQHNFPAIDLKPRKEWDYTYAAINSSSMFDMHPIMHWLTGNIGYHHVHHLNHRIPFYRLREAMEALPELQDPGRTSWKPKDVIGCLNLDLWDADKGRMVAFKEAGI